MTSDEIKELFLQAGCNPFTFTPLHDDYQCPPAAWCFKDFATALRQYQESFNLTQWTPDSNCCSNFALNAWIFARDLHHNSKRARRDTQIAMGVAVYYPDTEIAGRHMVNWFITLDGGKARLQFFEPQTRQRVELSDIERSTCELVWF